MKILARRLFVAALALLAPLASVWAQELAVPESGVVQVQALATIAPAVFAESAPSPSRSYFMVDTLIWSRSMTGGTLFSNNTNGATIVDTNSALRFDWNAAPKITLGVGVGDGLSAELCYFGFYDFRARGSSGPLDAGTAAVAALPFQNITPLLFNAGDTQRYDYHSRLTNAEFNVRKQINENWSALVGFRYLNLAEQFTGELIMANGIPFGSYGVRTENNLWGGQVGSDYTVVLSDRLKLTGMGKIGIFGASENQTTAGTFFNQGPDIFIPGRTGVALIPPMIIPGPLLPAERRASACQVACVAELGLTLTYQVTERLALRAGYNVMWIESVALAPNQFTTSNFADGGAAGIHTRGGVFMHGAVAGFEFRW